MWSHISRFLTSGALIHGLCVSALPNNPQVCNNVRVSVLFQQLNNSMNIVWWNGPSFRHTMHIPPQEMEIGCNFIQNHRPVRHVCAFDRQCVERIKNKPDVKFWTRASVVNDRYPHFKHLPSAILVSGFN